MARTDFNECGTVLPPIKMIGVDSNEYCAVGLLKLLGHRYSSVVECLPSMRKARVQFPTLQTPKMSRTEILMSDGLLFTSVRKRF